MECLFVRNELFVHLYSYAAQQDTVSDADQVLLPAFWTIEQIVFKDRVPT